MRTVEIVCESDRWRVSLTINATSNDKQNKTASITTVYFFYFYLFYCFNSVATLSYHSFIQIITTAKWNLTPKQMINFFSIVYYHIEIESLLLVGAFNGECHADI